jgi:hypothetical protein
MRRVMPMLVLAVAGAVVAATVADAVQHDTLTPIWEMAWLPAVIAGALYRSSGRLCRRAS